MYQIIGGLILNLGKVDANSIGFYNDHHITVMCAMRLLQSALCDSCGYGLISLVAVLQHHTAALRHLATALRPP